MGGSSSYIAGLAVSFEIISDHQTCGAKRHFAHPQYRATVDLADCRSFRCSRKNIRPSHTSNFTTSASHSPTGVQLLRRLFAQCVGAVDVHFREPYPFLRFGYAHCAL